MASRTVANPVKGLLFDFENSTITKAVWDEDNNLVEMTYCAFARWGTCMSIT